MAHIKEQIMQSSELGQKHIEENIEVEFNRENVFHAPIPELLHGCAIGTCDTQTIKSLIKTDPIYK